MRVLFIMSHSGGLRNFGSAIQELAARGHEVELAFERVKVKRDAAVTRQIAAGQKGVSISTLPPLPAAATRPGQEVRAALDYLRYLEPVFADTPYLSGRAAGQAPLGLPRVMGLPGFSTAAGRRRLRQALKGAARTLPVPANAIAYLEHKRPDVLLITPLVEFRNNQPEWLRAAHAVGIPTVLCVHSWDNLTNKALVHGEPDLLTVWNEAQRREASELHGISGERVAVVGAHPYDHWFHRRPSQSKDAFRELTGLPQGGRMLLYLCSSRQIAPDEEAFVGRWVKAVRGSVDPEIRDAALLVRPHPANPGDWSKLDLPGVSVYPRDGVNPIDEDSRQQFFDTMFHADAVIGLNTSAQIESSILGLPVLSILAPEYKGGQTGTLHFQHLLRDNGGPLWLADGLQAHVTQLSTALAAPRPDEAAQQFVRNFLRPHGADEDATPRLAEAIEQIAGAEVKAPARSSLPERAYSRGLQRAIDINRRSRRSAALIRSARDFIGEAEESIATVLDTPGPLLVGPWRGEVGFELLYWIPFLRWIFASRPDALERVTVLSRGGTAAWYGDLAPRYQDIFDLVDGRPLDLGDEELITRVKPKHVGPVDTELIARAGQANGEPFAATLHPWLLFRVYRDLRKAGQLARLDELLIFRPFQAPEPSERLVLPDRYSASRFYFNPPFPDTPENRAFAAAAQVALASDGDVVLLNSGLALDDHEDLERPDEDRIHDITPFMRPSDNLGVQTLAVAGADRFVGTYGGLSYLPPFYGVPSFSFLADAKSMLPHHLALAQRVFAGPDYGAFYAIDPRDAAELRLVLGGAQPAASRSTSG